VFGEYYIELRALTVLASRDSSVGIATGYGLDVRGIGYRVPTGASFFSSQYLGPIQPPIHWVPGAIFLGLKLSEHEGDHSPPTSAKKRNTWIYTFVPPYVFMA
jgi:hypothetical protein